jgi:8-oxo-dGTP pyrophosphatase MutT (NUDIX family)
MIALTGSRYHRIVKHAAGILLVRETDEALFLIRRSQQVRAPGLWTYPGGGLEPGETPWMAACREFREEVGGLPSMRFSTRFVARTRDGSTYTTFVCTVADRDARCFKPVLNWENDRAGWFTSLPRPMHRDAAAVIQQL